ncbi:MAG: tetratricopeptide repeat protein [Candidatus Polarisedimenticolaceae bacterium]|nr:tetratricopeptide repeat protein [Candidatus Polarisedimenticolaceae bacterium]
MRALYLLMPLMLLQGCFSTTRSDQERAGVIGSMTQQQWPAVEIRRDEPLITDRQQVQSHYRTLLKKRATEDGPLTVEATRRVTDLELRARQDQLFAEDTPAIEATSLQPTIRRYEQLLASNPDYKNSDRILYQLARAYGNSGETEQAHQVLGRLVAGYPQSKHYLEAQFRRAEYLFLHRAYTDAAEAYRSLIKADDNPKLQYRATYKLGWSHYKLQQTDAAIGSFIHLLDRLLAEDEVADQALLNDTLRITSLSFSSMGGEQAITHYFEKHGHRDYEYMLYQRMAELYQEQGRYRDAAQTYLAFVLLDPTHAKAPSLQAKEIAVYIEAGFIQQALLSKKGFIKRYRNDGFNWQQLESAGQTFVNQQLHLTLLELASEAHTNAQKKARKYRKKRQQNLDLAEHWYRTFISLFPADEQTGQVNFLLADLLFDQKRYKQAISEYRHAAYDYLAHEKSAEAGYALLLSYAAAGGDLEAADKTAWQQQAIKSALRFAAQFPEDRRRSGVMVDAAEQLFQLAEYAQALTVAQQVTAQQPPATAAQQLSAWKIVAHASFERSEFAQAEESYKRVLESLPSRSRQRTVFVERLAASIYKQGELERLVGQHQLAAAHFLRIGTQTPSASIVATADYDATISLITANDWTKAVQILVGFEKKYPGYKLLPEVRKNLALGYLNTDQPIKAATVFSQIAESDRSPEIQRDASWQAAELYQKAGSKWQAIGAYKRYVRAFPKPMAQALEGREQLVQLYQKINEPKKRDYWLRQIVKVDKAAGEARNDRSRYLAAKATYILSEPLFSDYERIELRIPLRKSLKKKRHRMKLAIDSYSRLAQYQVAEFATLATFRMAKIYQHLGQSLMTSDRPKGLNEEELEQYEMLLEEQAYPFEEKAIEIFQANAERTTMGIYDEWVKRSFTELAMLIPARYAKQERLTEVVSVLQ